MKKEEKKSRTVTIGPKYQVVIPKEIRRQYSSLKKGAKVRLYPLNDRTVAISVEDNNWTETHYGGLKDYWKDVDPIKQLKEMREEWDDEE